MSSQGQKTFKILCRTDEDYCITVRWDDDGGIAVVMAPTNPRDQQQVRQPLLLNQCPFIRL